MGEHLSPAARDTVRNQREANERLRAHLASVLKDRNEARAEAASLRAAGEELYEAIEFIAFDSEGDWIAGPTPEGRKNLLSAWRKATDA